MKSLLTGVILIITALNVNGQGIGELAPEKAPEKFPDNSLGIDIIFTEGGFGFGSFYRRQLSETFTAFVDFSITEAKENTEFEYFDYWGNPLPIPFKKNRVFLVPVNFGVQYRLFESVIHDNLRPYVNLGLGPTFVITTPYEKEFFSAFGDAHANYAAGGYAGFGANFGLDKSSLIGINLRYYVIHLFGNSVETLYGKHRKDFGGFFLTINLGIMY